MMRTARRIGFIGLGRMGRRMAANVAAAGHSLMVWNRTRQTAVSFAQTAGAEVAETPSALVDATDVVVTMVSDGEALGAVYQGADGVLAGLRPGKVAVDMSTVGPGVVKDLGEQVRATGASLVDAPVSGSTAAAEQATLMIMVGGDDESVALVEPLLGTMGDPVIRVGGPGAGATMKLAINSIVFGINQAVAEGLVLAERAGVDRTIAYDTFCQSAAGAPVVKYRRDIFVRPGELPVSFTIDLAVKDQRLAGRLADSVGAPMPQHAATTRFLEEAAEAGMGSSDMGDVAVFLRRLSG